MKDTSKLVGQIVDALAIKRCSIFKGAALTRDTENSEVWSFPVLDFERIIQSALGEACIEKQEVGFHFINVNGPRPANVCLHYHISHVVGFVVTGSGLLFHELDGHECEEPISARDIFVFPKGMNHLLASEDGQECHCVTFEFGPVLDYQAHHL